MDSLTNRGGKNEDSFFAKMIIDYIHNNDLWKHNTTIAWNHVDVNKRENELELAIRMNYLYRCGVKVCVYRDSLIAQPFDGKYPQHKYKKLKPYDTYSYQNGEPD